jgi:hypothetical protein
MAPKRVEADPLLARFDRLTEEERLHLARWLDGARSAGIDEVQDLSRRERLTTGMPDELRIIGVYRTGQSLASWVVIGHGGGWVVAACTRGTVSRVCDSFAESLALIHADSAQS